MFSSCAAYEQNAWRLLAYLPFSLQQRWRIGPSFEVDVGGVGRVAKVQLQVAVIQQLCQDPLILVLAHRLRQFAIVTSLQAIRIAFYHSLPEPTVLQICCSVASQQWSALRGLELRRYYHATADLRALLKATMASKSACDRALQR